MDAKSRTSPDEEGDVASVCPVPLSARAVLRSMNLENLKNLLPSKEERGKEIQNLSFQTIKDMEKLLSTVLRRFISLIFKEEVSVEAFAKSLSVRNENKFAVVISEGIRALKKRSPEREALMGALCTCLSRKDAFYALREMYPYVSSLPGLQTALPTAEIGLSGRFRTRYTRGRKFWNKLVSGNISPRSVICRKRLDDGPLRNAIRFILEDVQVLSWGTKRLQIASTNAEGISRVSETVFPGLTRKRSAEEMYKSYKSWIQGNPREFDNFENLHLPTGDAAAISRSSFLKITSHITKTQRKRKTAVDYVLGTLVHDNFALIRRVVSDNVPDKTQRAKLLAALDASEQHVKFSYIVGHVNRDEDAFHDGKFALEPSDRSESARISTCTQCLAPFQLFKEMLRACIVGIATDADEDDIRRVFRESEKKLLLFYGHQQRVRHQQLRISRLMEQIKEGCAERPSEVLALIDYKMKFESLRYREKSIEFFGKRGSSWHGAVVFFSDGDGGMQHLYFDTLSGDDTKQDVYAVSSMCDAVFRRLHIELPTVRVVHLLSDNARCYQNYVLPVILPFVAHSHGFTLRSFLHSETQDGKSLVDAHFAIAMRHINSFVSNYAQNIITPHQVVCALNSNGGMANTIAELVFINREHETLKKWGDLKKTGKLSDFGRVNEIQYDEISDGTVRAKVFLMSGFSYREYIFSREGSTRVAGGGHVQEEEEEGRSVEETEEDGDGDNEVVLQMPAFETQRAETGAPESRDENLASNRPMRSVRARRLPKRFLSDESAGLTEEEDCCRESNSDESDENASANSTTDSVALESEALNTCTETGVTVRTNSSLRRVRIQRTALASGQGSQDISEIDRAVHQLEDDEVPPSNARSRAWKRIHYICLSCDAELPSEMELKEHEECCPAPKASLLTVRSATLANALIGEGETKVHWNTDESPALAGFATRVEQDVKKRCARQPGWARRPAHGEEFGENTVPMFEHDLMSFYMLGARDKSKRMNAPVMLEKLRLKYPHRYDIPSEQFVIRFISSQNIRLKEILKNGGTLDNLAETRVPKKKRIPSVYVDALTALLRETELKLQPRNAYAKLIHHMNMDKNDLPADFPSEKTVKSKVSSLKTKLKKGS